MSKVVEINFLNEFLELRNVWNNILANSKDNNIFLTWEYLSTFWRHFGKRAKLRILLCKNGKDKIIGIAPLRLVHYKLANLFCYNVIEPLGYRGLMPEGGDYTGLLFKGKKENECLNSVLNYLIKHDGWNFIYLYDIPKESIIPYLLPKLAESLPITLEIKKGCVCPYIAISDSLDVFMKTLPGKFRKELKRVMRNLQKDFHKVELKRYYEIYSIEEAMNILFKLNKKRWRSKRMLGTFKTPEICAFYIDVAKILAEKGWLALYFLIVNDEPVAALYGFKYNQKFYAAVTGFDPLYSKYGVGNILFLKVIEECFKSKIREFDFMKGDEPYKFSWTKNYRENWNIRLINNKVSSRFYDLGIKVIKQIRADKILGKRVFLSDKRSIET